MLDYNDHTDQESLYLAPFGRDLWLYSPWARTAVNLAELTNQLRQSILSQRYLGRMGTSCEYLLGLSLGVSLSPFPLY